MNKTEYLSSISRTLSGRVPPEVQRETVEYYKRYIDEQIVKGTDEELVLATLGEPALLAKTVIASQPEAYRQDETRSAVPKAERDEQSRKLIIILVIALVLLFCVLGLVFKIVWKLLPILIPAGIVYYVIKRIRDR